MAQSSVYKVTFQLQNSGGRTTTGPYTTYIAVSGGTGNDGLTHSLANSLATAISSNLLSILQSMNAAITGVPNGTVVIDTFCHASVPNVWS